MRCALRALMASLSACIEPGLVPCGDQLCPTSATCVADALCASSEQLAACEGMADGSTCSVDRGVGRCDRGVCVPTGCGNGITDPGEVCDDANQTSGDGCRADCGKVELCGDAVLDAQDACDDGNNNPADGCDACIETTWRAEVVFGDSTSGMAIPLPIAVAADRYGSVFVTGGNRVRRIDPSGVITTVAGTGTAGFSGDGGAATTAQISWVAGVAVDGLGNVYFAEQNVHRVRRVDAAGIITTIAGTGTAGGAGDGAAAIAAQLNQPFGVAIDGLGNVYITERGGHRLRRIDPAGTITTIAGTGIPGMSGDGGAATSAQLNSPSGVATDALGSSVFVSDTNSHRVRRISAGGVITTIAGTVGGFSGDGGAATSARLSGPFGVAVDALGNVFVADSFNHRIRRIDPAGVITTVAGNAASGFSGDGVSATSTSLSYPEGVAVDGLGNVLVADTSNVRVRQIDPGGIITTVAGNGVSRTSGDGGAATSAELPYPVGVAMDALGNVYIADTNNHRIRRVDPSGIITTIAGTGAVGFSGDGGPATSAKLAAPRGVGLDGLGNVYIADSGNHRIRRVDPNGIITTIAGTGAYAFGGDGGPATSAQLYDPRGVATDGLGNVYIADSSNGRIRKVDPTGIITTIAGGGSGGDGGPASTAALWTPDGVAVDALGRIYVADMLDRRIRRIDTAGIITTVAGNGVAGFSGDGGAATDAQLQAPSAVAIDGLGNLFIADYGSRVRKVSTTGTITTVAGNGTKGFSGDGAAAMSAELDTPSGVAADAAGNFYVTDTGFPVVRRVTATGTITTIAGLIDPARMGPLAQAQLADPRALVVTPSVTWFAGGATGTIQAMRPNTARLDAVVGRYPQTVATGSLARFRDRTFGDVGGVAFDASAGVLYLTESSGHRIDAVTVVDPHDASTWTITPLANASGAAGFADGAAASARFRSPTGLYLDAASNQLYVADTGNHAVRAIDLSAGVGGAVVRTVAGIPATRGFFGDGGAALGALLYEPHAITRCGSDLFIADTGNHRVRRVAQDGVMSTVLGVGVASSSGEGRPAVTFPVSAPLGLACDAVGNLFVTSTSTIRMLAADAAGVVDGAGEVQTIYGGPPATAFPARLTRCLTGLAVTSASSVEVVDSCTGFHVALHREPR